MFFVIFKYVNHTAMRISALAYFRRKRKARSNENRCSLILSGIENVLFSFDFLFSRNAFARLIAYRAACFASGLAARLALAARRVATVVYNVSLNDFDMCHNILRNTKLDLYYYTIFGDINQAIAHTFRNLHTCLFQFFLRIFTAIIPLIIPATIPSTLSLSKCNPNEKFISSNENTRYDSHTNIKPVIMPRSHPLVGFFSEIKIPANTATVLIT